MHVVLYARHGHPPFTALAEGCQVAGHRVTWQRPGVWSGANDVVASASLVVVHGLHGRATAIRRVYRGRGVPVWILDLPLLRWESGAVGLFCDSLHDLPATVRRRCDETLIANRSARVLDLASAVVLVAGQMPNDMAHGKDAVALDRWARATIQHLRGVTTAPIVYRPHPDDVRQPSSDAFGADAWSDPSITPLASDLAQAAVVVVYNSTVGWDAIAANVPVIATAPRDAVSYADYVAFEIRDPLIPCVLEESTRVTALRRAASAQWTLDELRSGTAVRRCFDGEVIEEGEDPITEISTMTPAPSIAAPRRRRGKVA